MLGAVLSTALSVSAYSAEISLCGPFEAVDKAVREVREAPILAWQERDGTYRFFYGGAGRTWTLVAANGGDQFCIIREGVNFDILIK